MNYQLDDELKSLEKNRIPANLKLFPMMNAISGRFKCESDNNVTVTEYSISGYEGASLSTLVIEPNNTETVLPCLVYYHGGGFMLKSSAINHQIVKEYAAKVPCKVVYVDYRLAPDYPFPIPVEDCFATYKWVLENINELKIHPDKIMLGGDSAGGNLAIVVSMMARDRKIRIPDCTMLIYPSTDRRMMTDSMKKYTDTPVWDANLTKMMWDSYLGEQQPQHIEYASPIEASDFELFPTTYMEVAEFDALHDEGVFFYERLKECGIDVVLHEVKGACHGFENAFESSITRQCMERRIQWIRKHMFPFCFSFFASYATIFT